MKYFFLAREEFSNYIEGKALRTKTIDGVYRFNLEDIFNKYSNIRKIRNHQEELNVIEANFFFQRYGIKLKLIIAYNCKANRKNKRRHISIINALTKTSKDKSK